MTPRGALVTCRENRKAVMEYLRARSLVDTRFRVMGQENGIVIPLVVQAEGILPLAGGKAVDPRIFEGNYLGAPYELIRMESALGKHLSSMLPGKWEMIGDSVLIRLHRELEEHSAEVGRVYASVLRAKRVYAVTGRMQGRYRKPSVRLIYGEEGETVHRENGVEYVLDVSRVMFSSANHDERMRMCSLECSGEVVVDMFAGIGHLSMPVAVHCAPRRIIAAEADPETFACLLKTVEANRVRAIYSPVNMDNMELGVRECDRIIMGYLDGTRGWLGKALSMSRNGTIIHFHEEVRRGREEEWRRLVVEKYCEGTVRMLSMRRVKGYTALSDHMAMDLEVTRAT